MCKTGCQGDRSVRCVLVMGWVVLYVFLACFWEYVVILRLYGVGLTKRDLEVVLLGFSPFLCALPTTTLLLTTSHSLPTNAFVY